MVSGRPKDAVANCKVCGLETEIYAFADRERLVCPRCFAKQQPVQMSLFSRRFERLLQQTPDLPDDEEAEPAQYYMRCEGCMPKDEEGLGTCFAGPPVDGIPQCNCCKWIPNNEFYWNGQGACCQVKHDYILKRLEQRRQLWNRKRKEK